MRIEVSELQELPEVCARLLTALGDRHIVALDGKMGAGKTTLVSAICRILEMDEEASSPTFSIINEYRSSSTGKRVFHFDFYRIETPEEAAELGLDDYFDSGALCLMEWSGRAAAFLPEETAVVRIEELQDGHRLITLDE